MTLLFVVLVVASVLAGVLMAALALYTGRRDDEPPSPGWPFKVPDPSVTPWRKSR